MTLRMFLFCSTHHEKASFPDSILCREDMNTVHTSFPQSIPQVSIPLTVLDSASSRNLCIGDTAFNKIGKNSFLHDNRYILSLYNRYIFKFTYIFVRYKYLRFVV